MPQMFPMPAIFLIMMASILLFLSVVRMYWSPVMPCPFSVSKSSTPTYFNQTW